MGGFTDIFGGGGSQTLEPFTSDYAPRARSTMGHIGKLWRPSEQAKINQAFGPTDLETSTIRSLQGFDPASYFQGAQGYLGGANSMFGSAMNALTSPEGTYGGGDLLKQTIGGQFTDVANNPVYQARNQAIQNQAQNFLNQNLDVVRGAGQRASGGVGAGSSQAGEVGRTVRESAKNLSDILAQTSAQDLAGERGLQSQAMMAGIGLPFQQAAAMGNLASGVGQLGNIAGGFGSSIGQMQLGGMGQLANMASGLGQRGVQAFMTPYELNLQLLNAIKSGNVGASGLGILGSIGQGVGTLRQGLLG